MSIEGIILEHLSALPLTEIKQKIMFMPCSASLFFSDDSKQDSATTTANRKSFIELLKEKKLLKSTLSTI